MSVNKNYLQLEWSSGKWFQWSGTEKEGYEKHTSTKDKVSYRKYFNEGISGILESVNVRETDFGEQLSMTIKDGDNIYYLPVNIFDGNKHVDNNYAESLIKLLPVINKGKETTVRGYNFTPDGEKYPKVGISVTQDGEKLKSSLTHEYWKNGVHTPGDIPGIEWEDRKVLKVTKRMPTTASLEKRDNYLLAIIEEHENRLKWINPNGETPKPEVQQTPPIPAATPQEAFDTTKSFIPPTTDHDNLPF